MYWNQYSVAVFFAVLAVLNLMGFSALLSSGELKEVSKKMVQGLIMISTVAFFVAIAMIMPLPDAEVAQVKSAALAEEPTVTPSPEVTATGATEQASSAPVAEEPLAQTREDMPFGGIMIKNPSKQPFSIMMLDPETGDYYKQPMVNNHNEEVFTSWDEECPLEAVDDETSFEGHIVVGEKKHPFSFDSKIDKKLVKEIKI